MRLLLDSHVSLWWLDEDGPISLEIRDLIDDVANEVAVSAASVWELWIKRAKGRIRMPEDYVVQLDVREVDLLGVTADHGIAAADLPMHHRDPFDRMLIAQAQIEDYAIVTVDRMFAAYGVAVVAAR